MVFYLMILLLSNGLVSPWQGTRVEHVEGRAGFLLTDLYHCSPTVSSLILQALNSSYNWVGRIIWGTLQFG